MPDERGVLRAISWRDLCPWLILFRVFRLSIGLPLLFLATFGALLTPLGWRAGELLFIRGDDFQQDAAFARAAPFVAHNRLWPGHREGRFALEQDVPFPRVAPDPGGVQPPYPINRAFFSVSGDPAWVYQKLVEPFRQMFNIRWTLSKFAYFLFGGLWTLLVWAFFGGAITRIAAVHLGREERVNLREGLSFAWHKMAAFFLAPVFPLLGVALITLPVALLGLIVLLLDRAGASGAAVVVTGLFWWLVLVGGLAIAVLLLGLMFGFPLMWGTISSEGSDQFDALSRGYGYTFQRPLHYLFYALLAALLGVIGWWLVYLFSESVIEFSYWALSWGAGRDRALAMRDVALAPQAATGATWLGAWLLALFNGLVRAVAIGFSYSFFWCAATAIYLLLRHDVDRTELDEVYVEDEERRYGLPPLRMDKGGVPEVADEPAVPIKTATPDQPSPPGSNPPPGTPTPIGPVSPPNSASVTEPTLEPFQPPADDERTRE